MTFVDQHKTYGSKLMKKYLIVPVICSCTGTSAASSLLARATLNTANDMAIEMKTEASAIIRPMTGMSDTNVVEIIQDHLPGQILP